MNALVTERARAVARPGPGPAPVIETERLRLRPHRLSDAAAIAESLGDFQVARMLSRVPAPYHHQDALDWLNRQTADMLPDWTLAITTRATTSISAASASNSGTANGMSATG